MLLNVALAARTTLRSLPQLVLPFKHHHRAKTLTTTTCRFYQQSREETRQPRKRMSGRQDTFYFEESPVTAALGREERAVAYKRTPLVLVLGWAGAKDQNLAKYKDIYAELGFHTLRFSPSNRLTFLESAARHRGLAYELLSRVRDQHELVENPILVHMFSNACAIVLYQHIINEINGTSGVKSDPAFAFFKRNQRGVIFDSAPGIPNYGALFGGICELAEPQLKSTVLRYLLAGSIVGGFAAYQALHRGQSYFDRMFETLKRDERDWVPALGLYSKADKLIAAENIARLFAERRALFPAWRLKEVVYEDAPHVMLYPAHQEDYLRHVKQHLELCGLLPSRPASKL